MVAYAQPVLRCPELPSGHKRWHQMLPGEDNAGPRTPRAWTPGVRCSRGNMHLNTRLRLQLHAGDQRFFQRTRIICLMKTFQFERQQQARRRQTQIRGRKALQLRPCTARPGPPGVTGQHLEVGVLLTQQIHSWETGSNTPTSRRPSRVPTGRKLQSLGPLGRGAATPRPTPPPPLNPKGADRRRGSFRTQRGRGDTTLSRGHHAPAGLRWASRASAWLP